MANLDGAYLKLIDNLENELTESDVTKMKMHLKDTQFGGFRAGELSRTKTCRNVLVDLLERKGKFGPGNYDNLKELMKRVDNDRAVKMISEAEGNSRKRKNDAIHYQSDDNKRFKNSYNTSPSEGRPYVVLVYNTISQLEEEKRARLMDVENLIKIFGDMKSNIKEEENCSKKRFLELLDNMKSDLEFRNYTALFIIIISHGNENGIQMCKEDPNSDEVETDMFVKVKDIEERIVSDSDKLPCMAGKPKVIMVQACRNLTTGSDAAVEQDAVGKLPARDTHLPTNADILIAHATSKSYLAYRNSKEGSWFIKDFCEVVKNDSKDDHLVELLTTLNKKVAERKDNDQQMPTFASTLTEKFFLPYSKDS